jgi:hypothetical protein
LPISRAERWALCLFSEEPFAFGWAPLAFWACMGPQHSITPASASSSVVLLPSLVSWLDLPNSFVITTAA